eukprot:Amastigsp_a509716_29.p2 type:complete len:237 gc:universal Amastigsp_a509716_29:979-1689(+)
MRPCISHNGRCGLLVVSFEHQRRHLSQLCSARSCRQCPSRAVRVHNGGHLPHVVVPHACGHRSSALSRKSRVDASAQRAGDRSHSCALDHARGGLAVCCGHLWSHRRFGGDDDNVRDPSRLLAPHRRRLCARMGQSARAGACDRGRCSRDALHHCCPGLRSARSAAPRHALWRQTFTTRTDDACNPTDPDSRRSAGTGSTERPRCSAPHQRRISFALGRRARFESASESLVELTAA